MDPSPAFALAPSCGRSFVCRTVNCARRSFEKQALPRGIANGWGYESVSRGASRGGGSGAASNRQRSARREEANKTVIGYPPVSTPLYSGRVESKRGKTVRYRLTLSNDDVSDFGTDRLFAWRLLSTRITGPAAPSTTTSRGRDPALSRIETATATAIPVRTPSAAKPALASPAGWNRSRPPRARRGGASRTRPFRARVSHMDGHGPRKSTGYGPRSDEVGAASSANGGSNADGLAR
jgi:hypothetical protein